MNDGFCPALRREQRGYIVVETATSFMLFTLLMIAVLSLINIVAVQARVHYALSETAQTLSMYAYVLDATGMADHWMKSEKRAGEVRGELGTFKTNLNGLLDNLNARKPTETIESARDLFDEGKGVVDKFSSDPKSGIQDIMNFFLQEGVGALSEVMLRPLTGHYLKNGNTSGDDFLRGFRISDGVNSLEFYSFDLFDLSSAGETNTHLLDAKGNVKLIVQYDIDYTFGILPLPFEAGKLHVTQEVFTKAWLGGLGDGYKE